MKKVSLALIALLWANFLIAQSWITSSQIIGTADVLEHESVIDNDGNVFAYGSFQGTLTLPDGTEITSYGSDDFYLTKFLSDGTVDWVQHYGSAAYDFVVGGLDLDEDGNAYITGAFQGVMNYSATGTLTSTGTQDIFLIKVNTLGTSEWARNIGKGFFPQLPNALEIDNAGDILVAGIFMDSIEFNESLAFYASPMKFDAFYAKFNPNDGDLIWAKQVKTLNGEQSLILDIESSADSYYFSGIFVDTFAFELDTFVSDFDFYNTFIVKTDLSGTDEWHRKIEGNDRIYSYSIVLDDVGDVYLSSFYEADTLYIESEKDVFEEVVGNQGSYDIYIIKYNSSGDLAWHKTIGGKDNDRVFAVEFFDNKIYVAGFISDTVQWGGIQLTTSPPGNQDMFTGSVEKDGSFRDANTYPGQGSDESRAIFQNGNQLYTVMRSTSDNLIIGDSIYDSNAGAYYLVLGIIGCLPISVDNTIPTNISGCYGDSTGSIQVVASGGFGAPWQYSVDNGLGYSDVAFYQDLPADDYQVVVIDAEGCSQIGPLITLTEPDSLEAILVSSEDIKHHIAWNGPIETIDGSLVVTATGGTSPYTFQLLPGGTPQALGTYYFPYPDSGKYVVAVNDLNNCGPVATDTVVISVERTDATGIGDYNGAEVKVYPNPTSGIVTIEMPFEGRKCRMEVVNMTGQTVLKRKVYSNGGVITETLDLSDQAKGLYMVRIDGKALRSAIAVK